MKYKPTYQIISIFIISIMLSLPFVTFADPARLPLEVKRKQKSVVLRIKPDTSVEGVATREATRDVDSDIHKPMWMVIGCVFPGVGLLAPYFFKPPIPTGRLMGKSPEYVAHYSDAYNRVMEERQFNYALGGCLVGGAAYGGCLMLSISAGGY